jgi:hypothetical protein
MEIIYYIKADIKLLHPLETRNKQIVLKKTCKWKITQTFG